MKIKMWFMRGGIWLALTAATLALAQGAWPPAGWRQTERGAVETYVPTDLASGETFALTIFPAEQLGAQSLNEWLDAWAAKRIPGVAEGAIQSTLANEDKTASGRVRFRDARQQPLMAVFIALSLDGERVRALRLMGTPNDSLFRRYSKALRPFNDRLAQAEAAAYLAAGKEPQRAAGDASGESYVERKRKDAEDAYARAGVPRGSRAGGAFKFGTYEFEIPLTAINEITRYRISFYENGEWRQEAAEEWNEKTDKFEYDPRTGALDVDVGLSLYNSTYDESDFCRFYLAPDGSPWIYAEDDYGLGVRKITGRYVGPNKRPSPSAAKAAKKAAEAEQARFKYVTEPGKGVPAAAIVGVLYELDQVYTIGGLQLYEKSYLLLQDGSAYEDLRCPPDELDVAASRRFEPKAWGRWRKSGDKYELQFPGDDGRPGDWSVPSMATMGLPGVKGQRLDGRFENASSYSVIGGPSSVSFSGIRFTRDGRFETDFLNMIGMTSGFGDEQITTQSVADDEGASSAVAGPNFGGGSTSRTNNPKANRMGRYEIDGYTLLLRYDNGKVERLPFYFLYEDRSAIWFRGAAYSLPRKE